MNRFLDLLRRVFASHPHIDSAAIEQKIGDIQGGIQIVQSVVVSLPDGHTKAEALRVLDQAANIAAAAVVVAHTVQIVAGVQVAANAAAPGA